MPLKAGAAQDINSPATAGRDAYNLEMFRQRILETERMAGPAYARRQKAAREAEAREQKRIMARGRALIKAGKASTRFTLLPPAKSGALAAAGKRNVIDRREFFSPARREEAIAQCKEYLSLWPRIARESKIASNDAADAVALYLVYSWALGTKRSDEDVSHAHLTAVAKQWRQMMLADPLFQGKGEAYRRHIAEFYAIRAIDLLAHYQRAKERDAQTALSQASNNAKIAFQEVLQVEPSQMSLTSKGFVPVKAQ